MNEQFLTIPRPAHTYAQRIEMIGRHMREKAVLEKKIEDLEQWEPRFDTYYEADKRVVGAYVGVSVEVLKYAKDRGKVAISLGKNIAKQFQVFAEREDW